MFHDLGLPNKNVDTRTTAEKALEAQKKNEEKLIAKGQALQKKRDEALAVENGTSVPSSLVPAKRVIQDEDEGASGKYFPVDHTITDVLSVPLGGSTRVKKKETLHEDEDEMEVASNFGALVTNESVFSEPLVNGEFSVSSLNHLFRMFPDLQKSENGINIRFVENMIVYYDKDLYDDGECEFEELGRVYFS